MARPSLNALVPKLLTAKLNMPRQKANLVVRQTLINKLNKGLCNETGLFLVSAPAGYGKTTLVCEWLKRESCRKIWVSLDEQDNNPEQFMTYLQEAFRKVTPEAVQPIARRMFGLTELPSVDVLITPLINRLTALNERIVLVLDDYYLIRNSYIHAIIQFILDNWPSLFYVVLITCEDPPLNLSIMRAGKKITEIRANDLRFSENETAAFTGSMGIILEKETITLLNMMTEGWITGLQLAALSMQGRSLNENTDFLVDFSLNYYNIIDYLVSKVLANLSGKIRNFIHQTALLNYLCPLLCNTVTGLEDSRPFLELLEQKNLFLFPLDDQCEWYQYHPLFIDSIRAGLGREEQQALRQKAVQWCKANGYSEELIAQTVSPIAYQERYIRNLAYNSEVSSFPGLNSSLSNREIELMRLVAAGLSNEEIARIMMISLNTTKWHIRNIFFKLRVNSRIQAVMKAKELELL